ncbi:MAG: CPBP family intramembrane glutamic endopeptidase [Candidatus Promineifilaceae bacterium]|nr:CPBP family intramembrane glutamic endopeptidase [Candidatus Promineifilaceae bacterium]
MDLLIALLAVFILIYLANLAQATPREQLVTIVERLLVAFNLPALLLGLLLLTGVVDGALSGEGSTDAFTAPRVAGLTLLLSSLWGLLATTRRLRVSLARLIPLDPSSPVHTLALILSGYFVGNVVLTLTQGGLEALAETTTPTSIGEIVASQLLYVALAVLGVGALTRRSWQELLDRLGLERLTEGELTRSLRWVPILILLQFLALISFLLVNPEVAETLNDVNTLLLGDIDTVGEWFILALAAGVGEEVLFRGALQPVLGLWATSLLFAIAHIQYGITPATLLIFVVGLILGRIRMRINTTAAVVVHFGYNFALGLLQLLASAFAT